MFRFKKTSSIYSDKDVAYVFNNSTCSRDFARSQIHGLNGTQNMNTNNFKGFFASRSWKQIIFRNIGSIFPVKISNVKLILQENLHDF